jgi:diguanylate cyclase (GGDEF)-like protein
MSVLLMLLTVVLLSVLHSARDVRSLPPEQARRALPLHVRGIVTNLSGWKNSFFFQDDTAGISVDRRDTTSVRPGDEVEIDGETAPGLFAPVIISNKVRVVGHRPLPPPPLLRFEEIANGQKDAQWIAVRGIIRSAKIEPSWGRQVLFLNIDLGVGSIAARVHDFALNDPSSLVDAEVTARGVCGTNFNERRQFVGLRLFVNDLAGVQIERAAPADPFAIPTQPIAAILRFDPQQPARHRVKIEGVVTYQSPGRFLYVQNGGDGVYVESDQATIARPGTSVEVIGFASSGAYSPILQSASFRAGGHPRQPAIVTVPASRIITRNANMFLGAPYDGLLIRLRGELIERVNASGVELLLLRDGIIFRARLDHGNLGSLATGSLLEVTGVCTVRADESREPKAFEVELRTPADIVVVEAPSWWNLQHTLEALGVAIVLALIVLAWAGSLASRVKQQTHALENLARSDFLTGVRNRRAFYEAGENEVRRARRYKRPFAIAYFDLDNFKFVNDTLGHAEGDRLLLTVAGVLRTHTRATDVVARLGGDEFAVLLPETTGDAAQAVFEKLRAALLEAMQEESWPVTFSVGGIVAETPPANFEALVKDADQLMYTVKKSGKNRLVLEARTQ